ncbi:hypothetical protein P3S67_008900 [Capsicum chacoense]
MAAPWVPTFAEFSSRYFLVSYIMVSNFVGSDGEEFDPSSGLATCCLLEYDSMYPFLRALISSLSLKKPL